MTRTFAEQGARIAILDLDEKSAPDAARDVGPSTWDWRAT